jgi:predicted secreted protein
MSDVKTGVYPCYENQFQIDIAGNGTAEMKTIADCETFSVSFDNGVEEWTPFDTEGWVRRLMTSKAVTISITAKRNVGDDGNDAVAGLAFKNGRNVERDFEWVFPDGSKVKFASAVISVTNNGSGDSTAVAPLEFEVMSNGKPTYTPAA